MDSTVWGSIFFKYKRHAVAGTLRFMFTNVNMAQTRCWRDYFNGLPCQSISVLKQCLFLRVTGSQLPEVTRVFTAWNGMSNVDRARKKVLQSVRWSYLSSRILSGLIRLASHRIRSYRAVISSILNNLAEAPPTSSDPFDLSRPHQDPISKFILNNVAEFVCHDAELLCRSMWGAYSKFFLQQLAACNSGGSEFRYASRIESKF